MKNKIFPALLIASSLLTFPAMAEDAKPETKQPEASKPADASAAPTAATKDYTIIRFGDEDIKYSEVMEVWKGLFGAEAPDFNTFDEKMRQNVLRGLISEKLIYKEAMKAGFDKKDEVKKRVEAMQKQAVIQAFIEDKTKTLVTDDQMKAAYDAKVAEMKGREEVKARHILVATEEEAKKIAAELKKGGDFDKVAKEKSTDKGSGARGGDLGWFSKDRMVPEFADAAFKLKKGEVSAPVKSSFGWHIIKLDDRRPMKAPSFEEMKQSLKSELASKAISSYIEGLVKGVDIKYLDESGKEKPFSSSIPTEQSADKKADDAAASPADAKTEEKK